MPRRSIVPYLPGLRRNDNRGGFIIIICVILILLCMSLVGICGRYGPVEDTVGWLGDSQGYSGPIFLVV